jgi:hypothetical protein
MLSKSDKYTKIIVYSIFGMIGGIIIGLLLSIGQMNYTKKSERENASSIYAYGFSILFGIVGIGFAYKKAEDEIKAEELGLDKINSTKLKDGRKWIYESRWVTLDEKEYLLKTYHDKETKKTITSINDDFLLDHDTTSGAEKLISKEHFKALENLKKELKAKHTI